MAMSLAAMLFSEDGLCQLLQRMGEGVALAEMIGVSEATLEAMYTAGYNHYTQGSYHEAADIFSLLITYNHRDRRFFNGLAACLHMQKRYAEAIPYYAVVSSFDLDDMSPVLRIAECHLALDQKDLAFESLHYLRTRIEGQTEMNALLARVEGMMSLIEPHVSKLTSTMGE